MRTTAGLLALFYVLLSTVAAAESRLFIVPNAPDSYGIDECLATGARCGALVANSYCRSRDFVQAASFRKIDRAEITGSLGGTDESTGSHGALVAIECTR